MIFVVVRLDGRREEAVGFVHLGYEVIDRLDSAYRPHDRREVRDGEEHVRGVAGGHSSRRLGVHVAPVLRLLADDDVRVGGVEFVKQLLHALDAVGRLLHMPEDDLNRPLGCRRADGDCQEDSDQQQTSEL